MLGATSGQPGIDVLAVRLPNGVVNILVVNRIVADASDAGGPGGAATVEVRLTGVAGAGELTMTMLDAQTPLAAGPSPSALPRGSAATVSFAGYGAAILTYRPSAARAP